MFCKPDLEGYKQIAEGIQLKVLTYGDNMLMAEFHLAKGAHLPEHEHPHEQTGYVVSGKMRLNVQGQESFESGPGGSWSIAGGAPHSADTLEDSVVIEVFHPIREDFLK